MEEKIEQLEKRIVELTNERNEWREWMSRIIQNYHGMFIRSYPVDCHSNWNDVKNEYSWPGCKNDKR